MKLISAFILIACLQAHANGYSQSITISESNVSVEQIIKDIESQSQYKFFYKSKLLKQAANISVNIRNGSITEVLDQCLSNQPLTYAVVGNIVVIAKKKVIEKPAETTSLAAVERVPVKGKVTDENGIPLSGASVVLKGTMIGATTDGNGNFDLQIDKGKGELVISFVGYESAEVRFNGSTPLEIVLKKKSNAGEEIVVVGYSTQSKAKVTGSISTVKMDDLLGERPVSTTSSLLIGAVPGLQVSIPSGQPGSTTSLNIRGGTDINITGNSVNTGSPLILINNVPFNGPLNLLNPNDIESATFLKDAGAAAIYGGRSSFGVMLITLKSGKKNQKPLFQYSNNIIYANAYNLPEKADPMEFLKSLADAGTISYYSGQTVSTWTQLEQSYIADPSKYPGGISYVNGLGYQLAPTNVLKQLLGKSVPQFQNNFSVSGGSQNTSYRLSFGYDDQNGILAPRAHVDNFKRYTISSMVSSDLNKYLTTQLSVDYFNSTQTSPNNPSYQNAENYPVLTAITDSITTIGGATAVNGTPLYFASNGGTNVTKTGDTRMTGRAIVKPLKGLSVTTEYTYETGQANQQNYANPINPANSLNFTLGSPAPVGSYQVIYAPSTYNALNIFGNYSCSFNDNNFSFIAGFNKENSVAQADSTTRVDIINPQQPSIPGAIGLTTTGQSYSAFSLLGYFGRISYDYKAKYLVQVNGRYDGSSNFPPNHQYGFFPSASIGWRIMEENFMQRLKPVVSELKLRASYGSVGNQNILPYQFIPTLSPYNPSWLVSSALTTSLSTPALTSSSYTWEKVATLDYGADFGVVKNKLTGSFDWYRRETSGILSSAEPLPSVLGTGAPFQNTATLTTKGFEIQFNWRDKIGRVSYWVSANLSDYQSTITKFLNNPNGLLNYYYTGQKMGDIWGLTSDRFYTTDDFVAGTLSNNNTGGQLKPGVTHLQGELPNPGDMKYKAMGKDTVLTPGNNTVSNPGDYKIIGNNTPRYQFGIRGGASFKGLEFSFTITGVAKQTQDNINALTMPNYYPFATLYKSELNYWTPSNLNAFFPRIYDQAGANQTFNQLVQTRFLQNGAYLRINNLTLAYSLPQAIVRKAGLSSAKIYFSEENPFLFDHLPKGQDPSLANQAYGLQYPFLRQTSFGFNLAF